VDCLFFYFESLLRLLPSPATFPLRPKTHTRSSALCRSLNYTVWFRFDCNVQHYFVSIRKTFIDIFVALTELQKKKLLHTFCHRRTRNILFLHEKARQNFLCTKKQRKIFICTWSEYSTIASYWMLKCNASAVVVVAGKMWISQNMLWLPSSGRMWRL